MEDAEEFESAQLCAAGAWVLWNYVRGKKPPARSADGFFFLTPIHPPGANTVWYSSKFPLLYSLYVRSYTGTALGPQSGVLVAPFNIRGAKPKFPGRMQNFKTLLLARVRVLRRKSFRSQKG